MAPQTVDVACVSEIPSSRPRLIPQATAHATVWPLESEVTAVTSRSPCETQNDGFVGSVLFGDGAAAIVVGGDPSPSIERPLYELQWAGEMVLPENDGAIDGAACWTRNDLFWAVHPIGPAIVYQVEGKLEIEKPSFQPSPEILSDYGNMYSASVLFVSNRVRSWWSLEQNKSTLGEGTGNECKFLIGFGPGLLV
ncbi:hypothetical protein R1flu_021972 [Riccia fluitans]|uniref:Uncharacterized protein n=1 Tax=Riccia fluitans TaxID=41844 RepID=A0ABD1ZTU3_9MARC